MTNVGRNEFWITNDSSGSGEQTIGGAIVTGLAGLGAAVAGALTGGDDAGPTPQQGADGAMSQWEQWDRQMELNDRKERNERCRRSQLIGCAIYMDDKSSLRKIHEEAISDQKSFQEKMRTRASDILFARFERMRSSQDPSVDDFRRYALSMPRELVWEDDQGRRPILPPSIEELDLGFGGRYRYRGAVGGMRLPSSQSLLDEYYRGIARISAVDCREAAVIVACEIGCPGGLQGFASLRFDPAQIESRESGAEMLKLMNQIVRQQRGGAGGMLTKEDMMDGLAREIRVGQSNLLTCLSGALTDEIARINRGQAEAAVSRSMIDGDAFMRLSTGLGLRDTSRREALAPLLSFSCDDPGVSVAPSLCRRDGSSQGAMSVLNGRRNVARPRTSTSGQAPLRHQSLAQRAKEWLDDDGWLQVGERISEAALGYRVTEETKKSWSTWEEVGEQISSRVNEPPGAKDNLIRQTAHYYAVCWAKAKAEESPTQCIDVFKEHAWDGTKNAFRAMLVNKAARVASKNTGRAALFGALYDTISGVLDDPRCVDARQTDRVDVCVKEMYESVQSLLGEGEP